VTLMSTAPSHARTTVELSEFRLERPRKTPEEAQTKEQTLSIRFTRHNCRHVTRHRTTSTVSSQALASPQPRQAQRYCTKNYTTFKSVDFVFSLLIIVSDLESLRRMLTVKLKKKLIPVLILQLLQYSDGGARPSFTVRTVGPVTDFGELVCESVRQFLAHKQRQQQQQQQQVQSAVPWRRPRDVVGQSPVVAVPQSGFAAPPSTTAFHQKPFSSDSDQTADTSRLPLTSPVADDRNMFQRYGFQFGSIGNFGRGVGDVATPTAPAASRRGEQTCYTGSSSTAPIAVFRFQDFDDMVARMRDQSAPQMSG